VSDLIGHLRVLHERHRRLDAQMADPAIIASPAYKRVLADHARLGRVVRPFIEWSHIEDERAAAVALLADHEMRAMAREDIAVAEVQQAELIETIKGLLVTSDAASYRNAILEIRAGTGGDEAALFAGDLARMYGMWGQRQGLKLQPMTVAEGEQGGFREISFHVTGTTPEGLGAFGMLRFESGGHRVQRVPETESQGRVHTSAATVAVLPEAEEADVVINPADLEITTQKSGGAGGQHVNKTESAIRILHRPSGIAVLCQEERSQLSNRLRAMTWIRARLFEAERARIAQERAAARKDQVGSGERGDRIRTYNFPQNRITDHRINFTGYSLDRYISGECDELYHAMVEAEKVRFIVEWDGSL
jgi:peptide chain release factor 1